MYTAPTRVFVAGIGNSGPEHWQSIWHSRPPGGVWVEHRSWDHPERGEWVQEFDATLRKISGPKLLIAHSLGCTLVTEWGSEYADSQVVGSFLVAVPDVHGAGFPSTAVGFGTSRLVRPLFRTVVVASENDPFASLEHSSAVAESLAARLVNIGRKGHINADSGLGYWAEGWSVLSDEFMK